MGKVSLVDSQHTLCLDGLVKAVEDALVKVASLVVHSRHDGVCIRVSWMCYREMYATYQEGA